jgi:hypothetical protein
MSAGIACWSSLAAFIDAWMASKRSTGSSTSVCSSETTPVTRLVNVSPSPGTRTDTGISAFSEASGSASWSSR